MGLGDFLQGAAGGALGGAGIGGPWGALAGGVLGGLGGLFGGNKQEEDRKRMLDFYNQLGNPQQAGYSDFRNNQRNLITNLEAQAAGRGPSLATQMLNSATNRNVKQQIGLAQSGAGNATAAAMMAQNNAGQMGMQAAQDAATARMQEQLNAQQMLGLNLHGARQADESMNMFNAGQYMDQNRLRAMMLGQLSGGSAGQASTGQQILAGGAGLYGMRQQYNMLTRPNQPGATPLPGPMVSGNRYDGSGGSSYGKNGW